MSASPTEGNDSYLEEDTFYDPSGGDHESMRQLTPEEKERLREDWMAELNKTEEEITTLRQVLASKLRRSHELKSKLGITVWNEMREDLKKGVASIKDMPSYQKTTQVVKNAKEKTSTRWSAFRNSNIVKSFEDRVGNAYTNVKETMNNVIKEEGRIAGTKSEQDLQNPEAEATTNSVNDHLDVEGSNLKSSDEKVAT